MTSSDTYYQSYSLYDTEIALKLATDLINAGIETWNDRLRVPEMSDAVEAMRYALNNARSLLCLVSPSFLNARYAAHEWTHAARKGKTALTLRVAPTPAQVMAAPGSVAAYMRENFRFGRALDFDAWRDEAAYRAEFARLLSLFGEVPPARVPDARTQYVNLLVRHALTAQFYAELLDSPTDVLAPALGSKVRRGSSIEGIWGRLGRVAYAQDGRAHEVALATVQATATRFALHGAPGSGKSTALLRLLLEAARLYLAGGVQTQLPVLVNAGTWQHGEPFEDTVRRAVPFEYDTAKALFRGEAALFVDGISGHGEHSLALVAALRTYFQSARAPRYVVAAVPTRPDGSLLDVGLPAYTLKPWNSSEIRAYVQAQAGERTEKFLAALADADIGAQAMQHTPALLHGLLRLYCLNPQSALPVTTHELIDRLMPALWVFWSGTGALMPLSYAAFLKPVLQDIGLDLIDAETDTLPAVDVALKLRDPSLEAVQTARAMQIMRQEDGRIGFVSSLVRDYYAAAGLSLMELRMRLRAPQFDAQGNRMFTRWDTVLQLAVGLYPNPEEMLRNIAEIDPYLAVECVDEAGELSENALGDLLDRLLADFDIPQRHPALRAALRRLSGDRIVPILLDRVTQEGDVTTEAAAWALKEFDVSLPLTLLQKLEDWDWRPNSDVSTLLRTFPDREQIVAWLSDNLDDSDPRRRAGAAWGLGELRDSFGLMQLRKYANQEYNASVRDVILEAINTIISNEDMTPAPPAHTTLIPAEDAATDEHGHPEPVAAAVSPADLLLDQLLTFDSQQQAKAAALLAELPVTTYLPRVQALLTKPTAVNDRARFSLVRLLGHSGHPDALSTLLTVLRYDPEVRVKEAALEEITKYETHSAASIVALVTDPDLSLESLELVVRALGQSREPTIQDALVQLLKDERELPNKSRIRDVAYLALQHSEQPHIRHALDQYLLEHQRTQPVELVSPGDFPADAGDTPALKMARLVETLQGRRKTHELVAAARALTGYARELSKGSDESVLPVLAAAMQDPNYFVRWAVIEAIGFLRPDDALPQLNEALHDTHYTVRLAAINAMLEIGDKQSDVALLARMEDQHHEVRVKAAEALGELGTADTADRLLAYSRHPDFLTRSAVIASLGRLRNPGTLSAIADALKDEDMLVVSTAIKALGVMKHPEGVPHLVSMLADDRQSSWESKTLGELAIDALHSIGTADALAEIHRFRGRLARR